MFEKPADDCVVLHLNLNLLLGKQPADVPRKTIDSNFVFTCESTKDQIIMLQLCIVKKFQVCFMVSRVK